MEQVAMFAVLIAMTSLFLAVGTLIVSLLKSGLKVGFSLNQN
ncbi:hypothetical protein [Pseudogracilibacillus sp. SO30301A]